MTADSSTTNILAPVIFILLLYNPSTLAQTQQQPAKATPQPPLIDAQAVQSYEPETTEPLSSETRTDAADSQTDATPQPPLIDAQPEPSYEPEETGITTTGDRTDIEQTQDNRTSDEEEQSNQWLDTRPERVNADWLQLTSGEWLRGRIISMQQDTLVFELSLIHI